MRIVGWLLVEDFLKKHGNARPALTSWRSEVGESGWASLQDLMDRYPRASHIGGSQVVFRIQGNRFRILTRIDFANRLVRILRVGTHAEYDRW